MRSFFAASLLLPRKVRDPASVLYAFCRLADDAVDVDARPDALSQLRQRLDRAYRGNPRSAPVDHAFAEVVAHHAIPRRLPEALLEGLEWDMSGRHYDTLADLQHYAARVAGSVGAMMAILMDRRQPDVIARACDLGVAMQLTNIARDVGEDARNGRLYLPRGLAERKRDRCGRLARAAGVQRGTGRCRARLLGAADELYDRAGAGIDQLPAACRPGIRVAHALYREIGREVEQRQGELGVSPRRGRQRGEDGLMAGALSSRERSPNSAVAGAGRDPVSRFGGSGPCRAEVPPGFEGQHRLADRSVRAARAAPAVAAGRRGLSGGLRLIPAFMEFFIVVAALIGWGVLELVTLRMDRRRREEDERAASVGAGKDKASPDQ